MTSAFVPVSIAESNVSSAFLSSSKCPSSNLYFVTPSFAATSILSFATYIPETKPIVRIRNNATTRYFFQSPSNSRGIRLPGAFYNFHPGSHVGQGSEAGIELIAAALNECISSTQSVTILLETMAGKGSEVGRSFEELKEIMDRVSCKEKLGVCFDTCHVWDGGYDIVNHLDEVLSEFDRLIGLDKLCAVHLNDSMNDCGAHKDRHQKLGLGKIGEEALRRVVTHPALQGRPFILETPNEDDGYAREIAMVRKWQEQ